MKSKPVSIKVHGEPFKLTVFRVESFYENGVPENLTLIPDDMTCELSDDPTKNNFITVYVLHKTLRGS